jgi:hypothetical protein
MQTLLAGRFEYPLQEPGAWYLEAGLRDDYWEQIKGKELWSKKNQRGETVEDWHEVGPDHARDCEMLQLLSYLVFLPANKHREVAGVAANVEATETQESGINPYTGRPYGSY